MVNPERKKKLLHVGCGPKTRFQSTKIFCLNIKSLPQTVNKFENEITSSCGV